MKYIISQISKAHETKRNPIYTNLAFSKGSIFIVRPITIKIVYSGQNIKLNLHIFIHRWLKGFLHCNQLFLRSVYTTGCPKNMGIK